MSDYEKVQVPDAVRQRIQARVDAQTLRRAMPQYGLDGYQDQFSDAELSEIAAKAKKFVGRIRWSWVVVATNYMKTGVYKP